MAVIESKIQKFEVIELICRGCICTSNDLHIKKLFAFLRKFIKIIEDQHFLVLEATLPENIMKELRELHKLVVR